MLAKTKKTPSAFALAELMISIALIVVLTIAVSLTMHRIHQRTEQTKTSLAALQQKNDVLRTLAQDIRYATQLHNLYSNALLFSAPHDEGTRRVGYCLDQATRIVSRAYEYEDPVTLIEDVYFFSFTYDFYFSDEIPYVRGIEVAIQIGPSDEDLVKRYIKLPNNPKWPGY